MAKIVQNLNSISACLSKEQRVKVFGPDKSNHFIPTKQDTLSKYDLYQEEEEEGLDEIEPEESSCSHS